MTKNTAEPDVEVPKWDVALEALAKEEFTKCARELRVEDFKRLAMAYAIRFDDIMVTIFELTIHAKWQYRDSDGKDRPIGRDEIDKLYVQGRLREEDVRQYTGSWRPA